MNKPSNIIFTPNLEVTKPEESILEQYGYQPFKSRLFDLANLFKNNLDKDLTERIKANTYRDVARHYSGTGARINHITFNGIYKLAPLDLYMGNIPIENQKEIHSKFQKLDKNPFLEQKFELVILAPLNNFAEQSNITAIDPIVFAYFKRGSYTQQSENFLIALSQWD